MSKKAVIGFKSSMIASIIALLMLTLPLLAGNYLDKVRKGEGKFEFDEELCWDLNEVEVFDNSWVKGGASGVGAGVWTYTDTLSTAHEQHNKIDLITIPYNGTIDGYGVTTSIPKTGTIPSATLGSQLYAILTNLTKVDLLEDDPSSIDIFIDFGGVTFDTMNVVFVNKAGTNPLFTKTISVGNVTKIKLSVTDILKINTLTTTEQLRMDFQIPSGKGLTAGAYVIFDLQFNCKEEIKTPTLTTMGLYLAFGGLGYIFLAFIVAPEFTLEGTWKAIKKIMEGGK